MSVWVVHPLGVAADWLLSGRLGHLLVAIVRALSPDHVEGLARLGLWAADMVLLSIALPLVIGAGMRLFVLRPDEDAQPRRKAGTIGSAPETVVLHKQTRRHSWRERHP